MCSTEASEDTRITDTETAVNTTKWVLEALGDLRVCWGLKNCGGLNGQSPAVLCHISRMAELGLNKGAFFLNFYNEMFEMRIDLRGSVIVIDGLIINGNLIDFGIEYNNIKFTINGNGVDWHQFLRVCDTVVAARWNRKPRKLSVSMDAFFPQPSSVVTV
jgi:hypothetical protein